MRSGPKASLLLRLRDERGMALVTGILVSMAVFALGAVTVQLSFHNSEASTYDRKRVQAIAAAEAGLDYYLAHLQSVQLVSQVQCGFTQSLTSSPVASFEVTATFYDAAGSPLPTVTSNQCPMASQPAAVLIRSEGQGNSTTPTRTLESYVKLPALTAGTFGEAAVFSDESPLFAQGTSVKLNGNVADDADVYTNGNLVLNSGSQINGNAFVQGTVTLNNAKVMRSVFAKGSVALSGPSSRVADDVFSATSSVSNGGVIQGDTRAATTISGSGQFLGLKIANSPSDPPEYRSLPEFTYNPDDWIAFGYTVQTFTDCTSARTFIRNIASGNYAVRITSPCELLFASNSITTVRGKLGIIMDGQFHMGPKSQFTGAGGPWDVHVLAGLGQVDPCNIVLDSGAKFGAGVNVLLYTPCRATFNANGTLMSGQVFGSRVEFNSSGNMSYKPMVTPGASGGGFNEDIVYIREVAT